MFVEPNAEQRDSLAKHYKMLLEKAAEARLAHGGTSTEYAVATACLVATASAIQAAFCFETTTQAHRFLRGIAST